MSPRARADRCGPPSPADREVVRRFAAFLSAAPLPRDDFAQLPPWRRYHVRLLAWRVGRVERRSTLTPPLSSAARVVVHVDGPPVLPPMAVATRPQDWAEPARTILFGADALEQRRRA